jgi:clan AA aspartic protease (TIGR02281 family)
MFDKAEADYIQVIKMNESDVQALASLGRNHLAQKNYSESEKIFNQVVKLDPEYSSAYYFRSIMFFEQKKYNDAITDAFYAYNLDQTDKGFRRLFLNYAEKNIPFALSKVNTKINEFPEKDNWYFVRAQIYETNKDYFPAIADYSKMLDFTDANYRSTILQYRADCYKSEGLYDQAIADYDEAILSDTSQAYFYSGRADVKRLNGDYNGAVSDLTKAIKLEPEEAWYLYRRGWIKDEFLKDTEGGLKDYTESISLDNEYAYTYMHRGRLYKEKLKDEKKANEDFLMILKLDTTISNRGNCYQYALFHLGRNKEAIEWLNKILDIYPNDHNYYDAACLYSLMKMPNESIRNLSLSFENGYRDFIHLSKDDDLDNVRNIPEFTSLVNDWRNKYELTKSKNPLEIKSEEEITYQTTTIPMRSRGSGTYEVSCKVNDLKLNFIFDTGASDISISQTEALFMLKNEYLVEADIKGKERYMDANGDISVGTKILLKKVEIGGLVLKNVSASVVNNKNAPLLFGQSALSKYAKIIIDNKKSEITISVPESKRK